MPATKHNALSAAQVRTLTDPSVYTDGGGLTLRIEKSGNKHWVQRVRVDGKQRNIGIGGYPAVSLAEAREAATENLKAIRQGNNPIQDKANVKAERKAKDSIPTFREATESVIALRGPSWTSDRHATNWKASLERFAFPIIGDKRVDTITTADVMDILTPIWHEKATTARYVRQRVETVMDWAVAQGYLAINPANGSLSKAMPKQSRNREHFAAIGYGDVPATLVKIQESNADASAKLATEFLILTATRAGEVRFANWGEIDWNDKVWEIPAERTKMRRSHRIPLSDRAIEVLEKASELTGSDGLVFQSRKSGPLAVTAMWRCLKGIGVDATIHGFRSSFRDWMAECTGASWAVAEASLGHVVGNSTEQAYARSDYLELRRPIMEQWAAHCAG